MIDFSEDIQVATGPAESDNSLWVNKYRPRTLKDMCLADNIREAFEAQIKAGDIQNVSLIGPPGTGKTTLAMVLCNEVHAEPLFVACAGGDGRVDTIAAKIIPFCQCSSSARKVVILDELDSASATQANSFQKALRNVIEAYPDCRFIATANYAENIIEPVLSRIPQLALSFSQSQLMSRVGHIFKSENIEIEAGSSSTDMKPLIALLIRKTYPDIRALFGKLQLACSGGTLSMNKLKATLGGYDDENVNGFYEKVVEFCTKLRTDPLTMRNAVETYLSEAVRRGDNAIAEGRLTNSYEFARGLMMYCLNSGRIKDIDALIAMTEQLNTLERAVDKEIQVFRFLLLVSKYA